MFDRVTQQRRELEIFRGTRLERKKRRRPCRIDLGLIIRGTGDIAASMEQACTPIYRDFGFGRFGDESCFNLA
jgi:hypothetical protein